MTKIGFFRQHCQYCSSSLVWPMVHWKTNFRQLDETIWSPILSPFLYVGQLPRVVFVPKRIFRRWLLGCFLLWGNKSLHAIIFWTRSELVRLLSYTICHVWGFGRHQWKLRFYHLPIWPSFYRSTRRPLLKSLSFDLGHKLPLKPVKINGFWFSRHFSQFCWQLMKMAGISLNGKQGALRSKSYFYWKLLRIIIIWNNLISGVIKRHGFPIIIVVIFVLLIVGRGIYSLIRWAGTIRLFFSRI